MGINLDFAFDRTSSDPVDNSLVLTKAQMLAMNDNLMPDVYFAMCKDDGKMYIYNKSATSNATTGKYSEVSSSDKVFLATIGTTTAVELKVAIADGKIIVGVMDPSDISTSFVFTYNEANTVEDRVRLSYMTTISHETSDLTGRVIEYIVEDKNGTTTWEPSFTDLQERIQVEYAMDYPSESYDGKICQYVGQTNANYTRGFFYECREVTPATDPKTYEWVPINVQGGGGEEGKTYTMDWDEDTHELTLTDGTTPQNLELTGLQGELTAGDNISIVEDPYTGTTVISSTGGGSTYTAGNGIDITNDVISADIKTINSQSVTGSGNLTTGKVTSDVQTNSISIYEGTDSSVQISKDGNDAIRIQGYGEDDRGATQTLYDMSLASKGYVDTADANLQTQIDALGEPFRVKNWAGTFDVTIEPCTTDKTNAQLAKMTFTIDATEGADYQIVGMIAYEVFDAASGGNRLNVWPVCQFTGNGQKELSVRWVCAGTTVKTAKRINAWVLLKHR